MPLVFNCPNGHKLRVESELAGKKVRCPTCREVVAVPETAALPATDQPDADEDGPQSYGLQPSGPPPLRPDSIDGELAPSSKRSRKGRRKRSPRPLSPTEARLEKVNSGIRLHYIRIVLVLCVMVSPLVLAMLGAMVSAFGPAVARFFGVLFGVALLGLVLAPPILGIVGSVFCLPVPEETEARPWIITSLVLEFTWPILLVISLLIQGFSMAGVSALFEGSARLHASAVMLIGIPLSIVLVEASVLAPWICFMLFLNRLGSYLDRSELAHEALSWPIVLIRWGLIFGLGLGGFLSLAVHVRFNVSRDGARFLAGFLQLTVVVLFIAGLYFGFKLLLAYLDLLDRFRKALSERTGRTEAAAAAE